MLKCISVRVELLKHKGLLPCSTDAGKVELWAKGHQMIRMMIFAVYNQIL